MRIPAFSVLRRANWAFVLALSFWAARGDGQETGFFLPKIITIEGMARYSTNSPQTWRYAQVGDSVRSGTALQTRDDATIEIALNTAGAAANSPVDPVAKRQKSDHLLVLGDSVLLFTQVSYKGTDTLETLVIDLRTGGLTTAVSQLSAKSNFQIQLSAGVVSIKGATRCSIDASGIIIVNEGSVTFTGKLADGKSITKQLDSNQKFDISTGKTTKI